MVTLSPDKQNALWGVDQEFVGSAPVLTELLERRARTDAQRAALAAFSSASAKDPMLVGTLPKA